MAAATAVAKNTSPGLVVISGTCTLDPGAIAAGAEEDQTIAVAEAKVGDAVIVSPQAELTDGLVIGSAFVAAAGTITFKLENHSAGSINQASGTWNWMLIRGNNGIATAG